jgi:hypothetical protein
MTEVSALWGETGKRNSKTENREPAGGDATLRCATAELSASRWQV